MLIFIFEFQSQNTVAYANYIFERLSGKLTSFLLTLLLPGTPGIELYQIPIYSSKNDSPYSGNQLEGERCNSRFNKVKSCPKVHLSHETADPRINQYGIVFLVDKYYFFVLVSIKSLIYNIQYINKARYNEEILFVNSTENVIL